MTPETRDPPELRQARHRQGEGLQRGGGPSERDASAVLAAELGVFSQQRQSVLGRET